MSNKPNVKLSDYIPYQASEQDFKTDNSSDFDDDFSIAKSVIDFDSQNEVDETHTIVQKNSDSEERKSLVKETQHENLQERIENTIKQMKKQAKII